MTKEGSSPLWKENGKKIHLSFLSYLPNTILNQCTQSYFPVCMFSRPCQCTNESSKGTMHISHIISTSAPLSKLINLHIGSQKLPGTVNDNGWGMRGGWKWKANNFTRKFLVSLGQYKCVSHRPFSQLFGLHIKCVHMVWRCGDYKYVAVSRIEASSCNWGTIHSRYEPVLPVPK